MSRKHPPKYTLTKALLKPINSATIIFLGVYTMTWGVWLGNPFWSVFTRAQLYNKMGELAPEAAWGGIAIIAGIVMCYGAFKPSYNALVTGALTAFFHWFTIATFYFWGDWQNTGGITSLTFSVFAAYMYVNMRVNHRDGHMTIQEMLR